MKVLSAFLIIFFSFILPGSAIHREDHQVNDPLPTMKEEIIRNMQHLKMKRERPPSFISYLLTRTDALILEAQLGTLVSQERKKRGGLYIEVRIKDGSYPILEDDSDLDDDSRTGRESVQPAPFLGDGEALRKRLWLLTDREYRKSLSRSLTYRLSGKKQNGKGSYFSKEPKRQLIQPISMKTDPWTEEEWGQWMMQVSALFKDHPQIIESSLRLMVQRKEQWYTNTEGTDGIQAMDSYVLDVVAAGLSPDKSLLQTYRHFSSSAREGLPSLEKVRIEIQRMIDEINSLARSPSVEPYAGPIILSPDAAAIFFHEIIGHRLEGERLVMDKESQTHKGQMGKKILPEFLSIYDDPSQSIYRQTRLNGYYSFDQEGVPGQRVDLVKNGVLTGLLLSRTPAEGIANSNGHGRSDGQRKPMARMSNFYIQSTMEYEEKELKEKLLEECRKKNLSYGYWIRRAFEGQSLTRRGEPQSFQLAPMSLFRVYVENGREERVRGLELSGTPLGGAQSVIAAGKDYRVFNSFCGAESGMVPISTVAPSILIREAELHRAEEIEVTRPVLPMPKGLGLDEKKWPKKGGVK